MAFGLFLVIICSILIAISICRKRVLSFLCARSNVYFLAGLILIIIMGFRSFLFNDLFDFERFIYSIGFLILAMIGAICWVAIIESFPASVFLGSLRLACYLFLITAFISLIGYSPFFPDAVIPVVFFRETSHFALIFAPYLLAVLVLSSLKERCILVALSLIYSLIAVPNVTLISSLVFCMLVLVSFRKAVLGLILLAALVYYRGDSLYFIERLSFFDAETINLSTLVYQSAIERMLLALDHSSGLGVGFQQFGIVGDQGLVMLQLAALDADGLNQLDGGLVLSKFVGEMGVFAVIALLLYLIYCYRYLKSLHFISLSLATKKDAKAIFFMAIYVAFALQFFIRGTGYFSPGGFLFLISLVWISLNNSNASRVENKLERTLKV